MCAWGSKEGKGQDGWRSSEGVPDEAGDGRLQRWAGMVEWGGDGVR